MQESARERERHKKSNNLGDSNERIENLNNKPMNSIWKIEIVRKMNQNYKQQGF